MPADGFPDPLFVKPQNDLSFYLDNRDPDLTRSGDELLHFFLIKRNIDIREPDADVIKELFCPYAVRAGRSGVDRYLQTTPLRSRLPGRH